MKLLILLLFHVSVGELWGVSEYQTHGQHALKDLEMISIADGFCFLTHGRAWNKDREDCRVEQKSRYWHLVSLSDQKDFTCGATCVIAAAIVSGEQALSGKMKTGDTRLKLASSENTVCFFTRGRAWHKDQEWCDVYLENGTWWMTANSDQDDFGCAARCATMETGLTLTGKETRATGSGDQTISLGRDPSQFCFMTYGRFFERGGESCYIERNRYSTDGAWTMETQSGKNDFGCGAMCAVVESTYDDNMHSLWRHVATATNAAIGIDLTIGASRADGKTVTETFGTAFTVGIETGTKFLKVTMSTTVSQSVAESISSTTTVSYGETIRATCDREAGMNVALYQWEVTGNNMFGQDRVASAVFRCHYFEPHENAPAPQCPETACADLLCTAAKCRPWQA